MDSTSKLYLDWCNAKAANFACTHWHYSGVAPCFRTVRIGVWEYGAFVGCIIFGSGATQQLGSPYGLHQNQIAELQRVALRQHISPVSKMISRAIKMLRQQSPGLLMLVSFADTGQGHHGGIYQASNWIYAGTTSGANYYLCHGKKWHPRSIHAKYGSGSQTMAWLQKNVDPSARYVSDAKKHRYVMPLHESMREKLESLRKPYPKRPKQAMAATSGTAAA